jgi:hypothetical protein
MEPKPLWVTFVPARRTLLVPKISQKTRKGLLVPMNSQKARKKLLVPNRLQSYVQEDLKSLDKMQDLQKKWSRKEEERRDLKLLVPGRLIPAKRGDRPVAKRVGVASPVRTALAAVDLQKVRIDDGAMSADGENHPKGGFQDFKMLDKMQDLQNKLTRKEGECRDLNKIIKKLEILSAKKDEEIDQLRTRVEDLECDNSKKESQFKVFEEVIAEWQTRVQDLECDNLEKESQFKVFEEIIAEWQSHSAILEDSGVEWVSHSERLQTKLDEATSRFVGCEAGFSKIILSVLSTMLTNGMSVGVGSTYREAERLLKTCKVFDEGIEGNGFTKGYHEDLERGITREEVQKAKRGRIARSSDEDRFFEIPLERDAHKNYWQEEEKGHQEDHASLEVVSSSLCLEL